MPDLNLNIGSFSRHLTSCKLQVIFTHLLANCGCVFFWDVLSFKASSLPSFRPRSVQGKLKIRALVRPQDQIQANNIETRVTWGIERRLRFFLETKVSRVIPGTFKNGTPLWEAGPILFSNIFRGFLGVGVVWEIVWVRGPVRW